MKNLLRNTLISAAIVVIIYSILFLYVDRAIALWAQPFDGARVFNISQVISFFASINIWRPLLAISLIFVFIYEYLHGRKKWTVQWIYLLLSIMVASMLGDCFKYLLGRYRPIMLYEHAAYGFHFLGTQWSLNSTPSGHSLRIFSLMTGLTLMFRRYAWAFITIALLVGVSRIIVHDHYLSDVLFGAYLGIISAIWVRSFMLYAPKISADAPMLLTSTRIKNRYFSLG